MTMKVFICLVFISIVSPLSYSSSLALNDDSYDKIKDIEAYCIFVCNNHPEKGGLLCHCDGPPM